MGDFDAALKTDRELMRTILQLQREHYELWGAWPTAEQVAIQLRISHPEDIQGKRR